jgi:hypothetical protein
MNYNKEKTMFKKLHKTFKTEISSVKEEEAEQHLQDRVKHASELYSQALMAQKLSQGVANFAQARLEVEKCRMLYVKLRMPMPEHVEDFFNMANRTVSQLMFEYIPEKWEDALVQTMEGILDSTFTPESIAKGILDKLEVENADL